MHRRVYRSGDEHPARRARVKIARLPILISVVRFIELLSVDFTLRERSGCENGTGFVKVELI